MLSGGTLHRFDSLPERTNEIIKYFILSSENRTHNRRTSVSLRRFHFNTHICEAKKVIKHDNQHQHLPNALQTLAARANKQTIKQIKPTLANTVLGQILPNLLPHSSVRNKRFNKSSTSHDFC